MDSPVIRLKALLILHSKLLESSAEVLRFREVADSNAKQP